MTAERGRESVGRAVPVDSAGGAVVLRKDAAVGTLGRRNSIPGYDDFAHNLVPSELIGEMLRQCGRHVAVFAARNLEGKLLLVGEVLVDRQDGHGNGRDPCAAR